MTLWLILSAIGGAVLGFLAAIYMPWASSRKTETAFFLRRSKSTLWVYGPTMLYGILYVGTAVWGMRVLIFKDWKGVMDSGKTIDEIDYKIANAVLIWTAFSNSLSFCSKKVSEIGERKRQVEHETKAGLPDPNLR